MAADVLFLLTDVFPYAKGEEFLETEVPHLCRAFHRVVIIASKTSPADHQTRSLPDNAVALRVGGQVSHAPAQLATLALRGVGSLRAHDLVVTRGHPGKLALEAVFEARAQASMRQLREGLDVRLGEWGVQPGDTVSVYSYWFHTSARLGQLLADELRARGIQVRRLVSRAHRFDLYPEESPLGHLPQRDRLLRAYDAVHPVSDHGTELLRRTHPRWAGKIETRRLGTLDPGESVDIRRDPFHVVSCSWIAPVKRVGRFPGVLAGVQAAGIDVSWTHFGTGEGSDQIQAEADRLLGPGRVTLAGYVPNRELAQRYRELRPSVLLNLSSSEGLPVSMMEVAALGLPMVATDVGGVREIVRDGVNGHLLPADFTDDQAAAALSRIARLPEDEFLALGRQSRAVWDTDFNADRVYPAWAAELKG